MVGTVGRPGCSFPVPAVPTCWDSGPRGAPAEPHQGADARMSDDLSARDAKLIQYLNEAYGKEKELETALQAHIKMAGARASYKKRLQDHLKETKAQARGLERRIKQLGGKAETASLQIGRASYRRRG